MSDTQEPKLAPPGAGIPLQLRMLLTYVVKPFIAQRSDWLENARSFEAVTLKINFELKGLSDEDMQKRVLVPPQQGLEDSSRYWSIAMTLEHLVIVGSSIERVIGELTDGRAPSVVIDVAKVKPLGGVSSRSARDEFQRWVDGCEKRILERTKMETSKAKLAHPWTGEMNSLGWQWLLTQHHVIHLKQIRAIKKGLRS